MLSMRCLEHKIREQVGYHVAGDLGKGRMPCQRRQTFGELGKVGIKKDKSNKKLGAWDSQDWNKIQKETKAGLGKKGFWKCGPR